MRKLIAVIIALTAVLLCCRAFPDAVQAKDSDGDVVIVIDAGHGGDDPGTEAVTGAYEKDCNLEIALAMKQELGKYKGVKVYLTRSEDQWMTNTGRAMTAATLKADFLISLHNNSGSAANTGCIAYRSLNRSHSEATNEMCSLITDNLAALGLHNGGVQTRESTQYAGEDYYTLIGEGVRAGVPSIIVEHCFLSNPEDAALLTNADGTVNKEMAMKMGVADANAVVTYFGLSRRTGVADSESSVTLEKGSSIALSIPGYAGSDATWYSIDQGTAVVDGNGVATAVGAGTTNIVYKLGDGTTGYCTLTVSQPRMVAVTGGIDPTFYESQEKFNAIDLRSVFAFALYSDGSASRVTPEVTGKIDYNKVGFQDIGIKYNGIAGILRVCNSTAPFVPEASLPLELEQATGDGNETAAQSAGDTQKSTEGEQETTGDGQDGKPQEKDNITGKLIKYIAVLLIIVVVGIVLVILENNRRSRRGRRGRRR